MAEGTAPIVRAVFVAAAAAAMLHPAAALAQSSGCSAINAGLLDFNAVIVNSNASQPGTTSKFAGNTGALSMMRTTTSYTDNVAGTSNFAPDATTTYAFTTGDRLEFTANVSAINVIDSARIRFRAGLSTGNGAYIGSTGRADTTTTGTFTGYYVIPTGLRAVGMSVDSPNGNNVTASVSVICIPFAAPTPTLAVSMAHTGTPAQGGTVDYTIVPSASGAATSGTLTLAFTLPTGLSYASGTGTGWSCTSASCTYSTTIAAGASGNPLTLRANVAATAATSVTPSVSVSGGGAASAATANSPTTIAQVAASLTVTGGATQTATVGTAFATPLSVTVRDAASVVIPGTTVTFTAPGTGASGSFGNSSSAISVQSDASGVASSGTFTANTTAGSYTVSATAGSATASFTLTNGSAAVPPTVTGITPTSGTTAGGTSVVIAGTGLTGATTVHFGALRATSFTVSSATQITATTPAASAGVVDVTVTTGAGTSLTSAADQFTYVATPATPTLTSTPPSLSNSATATFQFTLGSGTAQCALDGGVFAACTSPISYSGLSDGSHTLDIRATNGGQTSASVSHQWTIDTTAPPPPVIGAPADGSNRPASLRSVSGTAAAGSTIIVYLDGTPDGTATADGSGNWTYTLATLAAGAHNVKARSSDAAGNVSADSATSTFTTVAVLTATQTVPVVTAVVNTAITPVQPVTASGGLAPIVYALTGATLPAGLTFATATGVVSGTASAPIAATSYTVTATDWLSQTASKTFTLSVSAASQTISFTSTAPSSAVIGGLPYTPSATATSGLTVSFAVDAASAGICTISGGSVSFTAAGTCRITADQAGNGSYAAAPQVQQSFTIGAASQTIGFTSTAPASAVVGGSPYTPSATATSGLTVTFAIDPASAGVCTISGGSVSFTGTGTCGITADQAGNGSYAAAPQVQQSFTIGAARQTIGFTSTAPASAKVGGESYTPAATATSGLSVRFAIDPSSAAVCVLSGGTVRFEAAGTCRITADQSGNGSYSAAPQSWQDVAVAKGDQTIDFAALANATLSASPLTLAGTATSGLPVRFTSNTPAVCTVAGTSVTLRAQGTCTLAADQDGTVDWLPAPTVTRGFTVLPVTLAITSGAAGVTQVGSPFEQANDPTGGIAPYSFTLASGAPPAGTSLDATTGAVRGTPTAAGPYSYAITVHDSASPVGTATGSVISGTVAKGAQTLGFTSTPPSPGVIGGDYTVAATSTAALAPAFAIAPASTAVCSVTGATVRFIAAGSCVILAEQPGTPNYDPAPGISQTVTIVAAPTTADRSGITVPYASSGTAIDLSGAIGGGAHTGLAIATPPAHGTTSVAGDIVTYVPAATFYGADSFTYTATGPGGTSAPATVSVTIATPAAPSAANLSAAIAFGSTGTPIELQPSGVYTSLAVATAPTKGSVTITGTTATYVPNAGGFGADSFTYTAAGPGGTSAPATVSVTIATPAAPGAANLTAAVAFGSTGTAIELQPSGVYASLAIATAPTKGSVTITGTTATYVPTAGSFGADSFTYTATGPGGTSAPATVSVTIATPAAPGAANLTAAVAFASTGTAVELQPSGVYATLAVATAPTKGSVTITGTTATYVPNAGSFGTDSFTYTATGPGGTSAPATVSVTIATPAAPGVANLSAAVAFASTGTAIDLQPSGVYVSLAVATVPTKGSVSITGTTATYVPNAGSFGTDSFTYTATGPGGTSAPATIGVTIDTPPAPTADPVSVDTTGTTVEGGASVGIDLSRLVSGSFSSLEIATPPAHGTVSLQSPTTAGPSPVQGGARALAAPRWTATYTPRAGFAGKDSFQFAAIGPGGRSPPATVEIVVTGQAPTAAPKSARTGDAQTVSIELTEGATGGPFTAATIDAILPVNAATAQIVQGGGAAEPTYRLDVTTTAHFDGTVVVRYRLGNAFGLSAATDVTVAIAARPDPSADPVVSAIADSQAETARRFARAQVANFMTRTQQLHHGGGATNPLGIAVTLRDAILTPGVDDAAGPGAQTLSASRSHLASATHAEAALPGRANDPVTASERLRRRGTRGDLGATDREPDQRAATQSPHDAATHGPRPIGDIALWSGGSIELGTLDRRSGRAKITLASGGLSAGADLRIADWGTLGVGGGYGSDVSRIDGEAARVRSETDVFAAYGSFAPIEGAFVDAVLGHGSLDYRTRRAVAATGAVALGTRGGTLTFGAVSAGVDQRDRAVRWSGYGRFEWLSGKLDAYAETGADRYDLRFDSRSVRSLTGVVGGRLETTQDLGFARLNPRVVAEWLHEFQGAGVQTLDYADFTGPSVYRIRNTGWQREQVQLAVGSRLTMMLDWILDAELGVRGAAGERVVNGRLTVSKKF